MRSAAVRAAHGDDPAVHRVDAEKKWEAKKH
jgi:hypothetical protein